MVRVYYVITTCIISLSLFSCSKKTTPANTPEAVAMEATVKTDSLALKKIAVKPKAKPVAIPKVIVVNDAGAKKAVDGRLYYDMQGRRYWRSNKDGKYYLYNKAMHSDPAFKAPAKKA